VIGQLATQKFKSRRIVEKRDRQVDRQIEGALFAQEKPPICDCLGNDELRQSRQKLLPHLRHETGGRYNSQQRVAHANKRFRPAQVEGLAADLGLVPQLQPPGPERFSHLFGWRVEIGVAVLKPAREMGHRSDSVRKRSRRAGCATAARIDAARERGRYSLRLQRHMPLRRHWQADTVMRLICRGQVHDAKVVK
jgi:hypothetical protein